MGLFGMPELDRHLEQALQAASKVSEMQERIAEIKGFGEAAEGRVKVEADNTGRVISVQFDPRAMRLASEDLAQAVLEAAQQASEEVATRTQELMNELMPDDGLNVGSLLSNDFSSLPEDAAEAINTVSRGTDPVQSVQAALAQLQARIRR